VGLFLAISIKDFIYAPELSTAQVKSSLMRKKNNVLLIFIPQNVISIPALRQLPLFAGAEDCISKHSPPHVPCQI